MNSTEIVGIQIEKAFALQTDRMVEELTKDDDLKTKNRTNEIGKIFSADNSSRHCSALFIVFVVWISSAAQSRERMGRSNAQKRSFLGANV